MLFFGIVTMGKGVCFIIWMGSFLFIFIGADKGIGWCEVAQEWIIGGMVSGLLVLAVLWVINLFLDLFSS